MQDQTIALLRKAAIQFRYYAQEHLKKKTEEGRMKSAINLSLAEQIEDHLRTIHHQTHPLAPEEQPVTPDNMSREDWARSATFSG